MTGMEIVTTQENAAIVGSSLSSTLVADWLAFNADKSPATVATYSKALKNFFRWLSDNNVKAPRREHVIAYRDWLCATKRITTARLYTTAVKVFSKWLASIGVYLDFVGCRITTSRLRAGNM